MPKVIVDANKRTFSLNLKELFAYKDLLLILAYRDYKVRYAQTFLGFVWAFIQPLATLLIFILVFGKAAKVPTGNIPYPLFAVCGMSAWTYFAFVMSQAGSSIINAQQMVQKIYFPRLVIPLSKAILGLIDFAIALLMVVVILLLFHFKPSSHILLLPLFIVVAMISALGVGIWLSALTIRYRDFQHIVPFLVQIGTYATPVAYPSELVVRNFPEWVSVIYFLNPMAGVVEGFRWCILGTAPPGYLSYISFAMIVMLFVSSLFYFRKIEKVMADIV